MLWSVFAASPESSGVAVVVLSQVPVRDRPHLVSAMDTVFQTRALCLLLVSSPEPAFAQRGVVESQLVAFLRG